MPSKKPIREEIRTMAEEEIEKLPFIRLDTPADIRAELDDIWASFTKPLRARIREVGVKRSVEPKRGERSLAQSEMSRRAHKAVQLP